jgi:hypothetical protein
VLQAGRVSVNERLLDVLQRDLGYHIDDSGTTTANDVRVRLLQVAGCSSRYSSSDSIKVSIVTSGTTHNTLQPMSASMC